MSGGTIQIVNGVAQTQLGGRAESSFPAVSTAIIYSAQAYCAFPRVLKLADGSGYLIACKGGDSHNGAGSGKILFSSDFVTWTVRATIEPESPRVQLQDPVLCQHVDGRLQLVTRHGTYPTLAQVNRVQYSSDNGATWTTATAIAGLDEYAYATARVGSSIYLSSYNLTNAARLYRFTGDTTVELVSTISDQGSEVGLCEASNGDIVAHCRHTPGGVDAAASTVRSASYPFTSWTTQTTWSPWHGQVIRRAPDGSLWGLGRWFHNPTAVSGASITAVAKYDGYTPRVIAYLPPISSSEWGDCGYGDLVWIGAETLPRAIYYAPGGTTTAIYTATIT